jgi:hypothetical protein
MTKEDLIELGFDRFDEYDSDVGDWYYYESTWNGIELITNPSDEWNSKGMYVEIIDTDVRFRSLNDLWALKEILSNNMK